MKKNLYSFVIVTALLGFLFEGASGATLYSIASSGWATAGTWSFSSGGASCGCTPGSSDDVIVESGFTITMDGNPGAAASLTVTSGTLNWTTARTTNIGAGGINIGASGDITGAVSGVLTSTGGLTLNAVLTSTSVNTRLITTAVQTISGTGTIRRLEIGAGVVATNSGTLTVTTNLNGAGTFTNGTGATLNFSVVAMNVSTLDASSNTPNTVNYNITSGSQNIKATNYYNLTLSNAGSKYFLAGTTGIANTLSIAGGGVNATAYSSTVSFNGSGAQSVNSSFSYHHLTINKTAGTATLSGNIIVYGNFNISDGTFDCSTRIMQVKGNFTNSDIFTASTGMVGLNGTAAQSITGSTTFYNVSFNNASGLTLNDNITINNTLTLNGGNITTGANSLTIGSAGSVTRNSGHIVGNMIKTISAASPNKTFEIGTGANYTPVSVAFSGVTVTGTLTITTAAGDHADIGTSGFDDTKTVNRTWTMTNTGITFTSCSATFNFVAGDVDGGVNTALLQAKRYSGAAWFSTNTGTRTSTSTQVINITSFSDFQLGEITSAQTLYSIASSAWTNGSTWSLTSGGAACGCTPTSLDSVVVEGGYTITMDGNSGAASGINVTNGTLNWTSAYTTDIGVGGITIGASGNITGAVAGVLTSTGGLSINAVTTSTTVNVKLQTTAAQNISGTGSLGILEIASGVTATNTGTLTVTTNLKGSGNFTSGTGSTLNFGGASIPVTTLDASTNTPNTVNYNASAGSQNVKAVNYYNLSFSNAGSKYFLGGTTGIANTLSIAGGGINATANSSTISFNGGGAQSIPNNFSFYNLTLANAGTKTLSSASTYNIYGSFTITGAATLDATTNSAAVNFAASGAQTVAATTYYGLQLTGSGTKTFSAGTTDIKNNLSLGGTATGDLTTNSTTVSFSKSGNQNVAGLNYYNLTISGSGTKTLTGAGSLQGTLTITAGTFNLNALAFTIKSNSGGTAQVAQIAGTLSGASNVTVERYIAGPDSGSRDVGIPVSGRIVDDWEDDITISYRPAFWGNVQVYWEVNNTWQEFMEGWSITPGRGYDIYVYDGDLPSTLDLTGTLVQGDVNYAMTFAAGGGYELVGNPYACDIDLEDADWSRPSVSTTYSVWDDAIYDYRYYTVGVGPGAPAGSRYIASQQGFWAQATAATTFGFREGVKAPATATFYKSQPTDAFVINLGGNNYATSTALRFRNDATEAYDAELDATKRTSPDKRAAAYLASMSSDGKPLASNCLPEIKGNTSIPLVAKAHREGIYTISLSNIPSSIPAHAKILLEDLASGTMTEMKKKSSYSFTLDGNFDNNSPRFVLHIITDPSSPIKASTTESVQMFSYDNKAHLLFSFTEDTDVTVDVFNLMGQKTGATEHHRVKNQTIVMNLPQNGNGIYLVTVTTPSGVISKKVQAVR